MPDLLKKYSSVPATRRTVNHLLAKNALLSLEGATITAVTDNSTGAAEGDNAAISLQRQPFTHVGAETDLALQTSFDTQSGAANDAIAVLAGLLDEIATPIELTTITGGDGTVAVAGTIPAIGQTITGTAGGTAVAVPRSGANAVLLNIRNNLSTLILAHNRIADLLGQARIVDRGEGVADGGLVLANLPADSGTAVDASGDAMSKAHADAQFKIVADNVAYIGRKITALQTYIAAA